MLTKEMEDQLNNQINAELYSSYVYLSMSAYCSHKDMNGFAHWLKLQSQEEIGHAMRIYDYINEHGGQVRLKALAEPKSDFNSFFELFRAVLAHEQKVTKMIHELMDLAIKLNDHATKGFLQWFVQEQIEEEAMAGEALHKVELVKDHGPGLLALDRELGSRSSAD